MNKELTDAYNFACSVMESKGCYYFPESPEDALLQLKQKAFDMSEHMAIQKLVEAGVKAD